MNNIEKIITQIDSIISELSESEEAVCYLTSEDLEMLNTIKEILFLSDHNGKWIDNNNGTLSCNKCHTWFYKNDRFSYMNYCPNCRANMNK